MPMNPELTKCLGKKFYLTICEDSPSLNIVRLPRGNEPGYLHYEGGGELHGIFFRANAHDQNLTAWSSCTGDCTPRETPEELFSIIVLVSSEGDLCLEMVLHLVDRRIRFIPPKERSFWPSEEVAELSLHRVVC